MRPLMQRPPAPLTDDDRVLVVRLGAVGDVLRALPMVEALRRSFPSIHLAWIVEELSYPLLEGHRSLDQVLRFPRRQWSGLARRPWMMAGMVRDLRGRLRDERYSVAVDLQSSFKSGLLTRLSGARRRVGFSPGHCRELSFLFTNEWVPLSSPWLNRVDRNLEMAASLGATTGAATMTLEETPEEASAATALLSALAPEGGPVVLLSPGTSRRQAFKMWPPAHYARLASLMHSSLGIRPIVVWGPGEERLAQESAGQGDHAARMAPSTSLRLLAALLRRATLFVGADTGPMHLAWAVGCPVLALFGPTDPRLNAPLGSGHRVLRSPLGPMEALTPDTVLAAASELLAVARSPGAAR